MKKLILFILSVFALKATIFSQASIGWQDKIKWSFSVEKINESRANVVLSAKLSKGFHVFSVNHIPENADLTGIPTSISIAENKNFKVVGKLKDGIKAHIVKDELGTQIYFEEIGVFKQEIEILTDKRFKIPFEYSFQICNADGCIFPPDQEGSVEISGFKPDLNAEKTTNEDSLNGSKTEPISSSNEEQKGQSLELKQSSPKKKDSNLLIFIAGFIAGLVALLTPCMFPMIPMTVTFFTKQSKSRSEGIFKALIYGFSIVLIYVSFGLIFTAATGPLGLNDLSTNVWMNLIFFSVFMLFAFSFLGAFEIQLPSSWVNKMDSQADKGGLIGIFFMAFTLGLVSFSCTGPIIGSLLVEASTTGSYLTPAIGMTGFSLALAIPFTLFAIFPGWLNSLPQSGGWLNSVKVVLGLTEIALALKFLSSVDLAYHWNILSREWFVAIWFVLFLIMGIYLLGKLRFSHDSPIEKISVPRFMFALAALTFSVYLLPGMFGAPLNLIDGIAPPRTHSEDNFRYVNGGLETGIEKDSLASKYHEFMHPVGDGSILVFHDLKKGTAYAKERNLPILLDFTGHACQNCRKTESTVWTNDEIRPILQKKVVIVSLYCDDKTKLPKNQVYYSKAIGGKVKTVGNKWSEFQVKKYKSLQQPLYVIIDHKGNDLTETIGYTPNIQEYKSFLMKGINRFGN